MNKFEVISKPLNDLIILRKKAFQDHRGYFARLFCEDDFKALNIHKKIVQMNHSITSNVGAIRGLHFQTMPHTEMKIITCISGMVFDVAVDIRKDSPTFLQWHGEILSAENQKTFIIPEGFAHGFQVLEENSQLLYLHTEFYNPSADCGLNPFDPKINIEWRLNVTDISDKDKHRNYIQDIDFKGISL